MLVTVVTLVQKMYLKQTRSAEFSSFVTVTVTVTVTKIFILRFLLKDRKCITESFTYDQRRPGEIKQF